MFLGISCVFIGVIISWLGITSAYALRATGIGQTGFTLQASSPGVICMIGGITLIALSLYKDIHYKETMSPGGSAIVQPPLVDK